MNVRVENNQICAGDGLRIELQRTLRIPDDGKQYPLPPGLGAFPVKRVDDYSARVPAEWRARGGVFVPMYQREALWLSFQGQPWKPRAVKVGVGKVCAITGAPWSEALRDGLTGDAPQDYVVTPPQPWLDGICSGSGVIRQFVAMPLGMGYTVEAQVTGEERFGGIQIKVFEPRPGRFPDQPPPPPPSAMAGVKRSMPRSAPPRAPGAASMGLAAGGRMKQKIYRDPHGVETWDPGQTARVFVHIVNSAMYREITGEAPPQTPVTAKEYAARGYPWFDLYDEGAAAVDGSQALAQVKSVKELDGETFAWPQQDDDSVTPGPVKTIAPKGGVRDGDW